MQLAVAGQGARSPQRRPRGPVQRTPTVNPGGRACRDLDLSAPGCTVSTAAPSPGLGHCSTTDGRRTSRPG